MTTLRREIREVVHEVTPDNFLRKQLEVALGYVLTRKMLLTDDDLEDIVMSEKFKGYRWKPTDEEFTNLIRETDPCTAMNMAIAFLDQYDR